MLFVPEDLTFGPISACRGRSGGWTDLVMATSLSGITRQNESRSTLLKHDGFGDLGNPKKRKARGYAYQALTAGFAAAVSNMRRIVSFIANVAIKALGETALRNLRRYDENDNPIPHA